MNKNRSFSYETNNLLDEIKHEEGKYTAYLFKSLTLKAIEKLIFIKAFWEVNYRVYSNWKQKNIKKWTRL